MQSQIAAAVSESLKVAILEGNGVHWMSFPPRNLKAYESYVAGRYQLDLLSHESLPQAIRAVRPGHRPRSQSSSTPISPGAMPTASCSATSSRRSTCCRRWSIRSAEAQAVAPRFCRGVVFPRPDLCDGLALEGCLDRVEQGEAPRPDAGADGTGFRAVLLRARRSGKGQACAGRRRAPRSAQRGNGGLGKLGAVHGGRKQGGAGVGR